MQKSKSSQVEILSPLAEFQHRRALRLSTDKQKSKWSVLDDLRIGKTFRISGDETYFKRGQSNLICEYIEGLWFGCPDQVRILRSIRERGINYV